MTTNRTTMHDYDQRNYESKTNGKISLDDFIYELELRNEEMSNEIERRTDSNGHHDQSIHGKNGSNSSQQLHPPTTISNGSSSTPTIQNDHQILLEQLAKKEKDLILAAELGKALLDRNEELTRTNEQINEEYTHNLELLEQEKYALRKKLNSIEVEYENKVIELQADLTVLREKLSSHLEISKQNEAENSRIIDELTEQNQRLTSELTKSSTRESLLEKEIQSLKEQFQARRTNFTDHIGQLEGLRDEINLLSRRKLELEGKISFLNDEKDSITISLDESQYRILSLEKQIHEKDLFIQSQQKDLDEQRRMNTQYQNRLESFNKIKHFETYKVNGSSLYNEIEMSSHSSGDEHLHASPNYLSEEENDNMGCQCAKQKQEMFDLHHKLKCIYDDLYRRRPTDHSNTIQMNVSSSSSHDSGIQANLSCVEELNDIICDIQELIKNIDLLQCVTCQEFNQERIELDRIRKENHSNKDRAQKLNNELINLTSKLTIMESESIALNEENKILKDDIDSMTDLSKDEIVRRAWKMRDDTIARKKTVEIELAKVRIELMHVNSQLLETIQQKVELSQQLEQWQVDMEQLIEEQLKNKLSLQEKTSRPNVVAEVTPTKKENLFDRIRFPKFPNPLR
ncbi:coiled-coil domain containing protein 64 [Blomia tropicalis]|nr:coiled-coil domain containing protein 64 [Blomia tropicalis]